MATSTKTHDYMGRALSNASPGVTNPVKDYIGRNTGSTTDYMGLLLEDDPAGSIAGTITDADGDAPIEGATVTAGGASDVTNSDGEYLLAGLQPATAYTVTASADGYDDSTITDIAVDPGEAVTGVDLELDAST